LVALIKEATGSLRSKLLRIDHTSLISMASPQEAMTSPEALREFWAASGMNSQAAIDHVIPGEHYYDGIWRPEITSKESLDRTKQFEFRDTDVVLATYPKSGTTWMSKILVELRAAMGSPKPKLEYLEFQRGPIACIDNIEKLADPRVYKTHLVVDYYKKPLAERKTKVIVVNRNVKDALVSFYHFYASNPFLGKFKGSFSDFMEMVKVNRVQNWFNWVEGWWAYKEHANVLFLTYEDMKTDAAHEIRKVCDFLGYDVSDDTIADVAQKSSFSSMRADTELNEMLSRAADPTISPFLRKGIVGDWNNYFTDELNNYVDSLYKDRIESKGLTFKFQ